MSSSINFPVIIFYDFLSATRPRFSDGPELPETYRVAATPRRPLSNLSQGLAEREGILGTAIAAPERRRKRPADYRTRRPGDSTTLYINVSTDR